MASSAPRKAFHQKGGQRRRQPDHGVRHRVPRRRVRRAHHHVAEARHRGADLHPVQRLPAAHRRRLSGPHPARRAGVHRDRRHSTGRPGLVRVLHRLPRRHGGDQRKRNVDLPIRLLLVELLLHFFL